MNLNLIYDSSTSSAPAGFLTAMNYVVSWLDSTFTNPVTVNINVGWGEVHGQALVPGALGESITSSSQLYSYSQILNALIANNAKSATDITADASLAAADPTNGGGLRIGDADAKALGLLPATSATIDGWVGFDSAPGIFTFDPNNRAVSGLYDFIGVAFHEITEVMGRIAGLSSFGYSVMDLFRYSAPGARQLTGGQAAYFSIDGGTTDLADYNTNSKGDFGDWASTAGHDAFLAFFSSGVLNAFTSTDVALMDAIGWNTVAPIAPIVTPASIQNDYFAITRTPLPLDQATATAGAINAGTQTQTQYINSLLAQVANTTIPAIAVEATMYNAVGTSDEVTLLAAQFLPGQVAYATQHGFNPQVFATEVLGLTFAFGNEVGSNLFAAKYGPANSAVPNTVAGDASFAAMAATAVYGSASTANLINVLETWVGNWKSFYSSHGIPGIASASADQIDLAARGAAWGDAVGVALNNNLGPLLGQVVNFLDHAAQGTALYSISLASQPSAAGSVMASEAVAVTGIAAHLDIGLT